MQMYNFFIIIIFFNAGTFWETQSIMCETREQYSSQPRQFYYTSNLKVLSDFCFKKKKKRNSVWGCNRRGEGGGGKEEEGARQLISNQRHGSGTNVSAILLQQAIIH